MEEWREKLKGFKKFKREYFFVGLVIVGVFLIIFGLTAGKNLFNKEPEVVFESSLGERKGEFLTVDVAGAVERPGVYQLPYNSRRQDALITAGGLGAKADRNYVAKYINLAQKVTDGEKIYVPWENQENREGKGDKININTAATMELESLPGVGTVTAGKIIQNRPYQNVSELVSKKVVAASVLEKIKDRLSVY